MNNRIVKLARPNKTRRIDSTRIDDKAERRAHKEYRQARACGGKRMVFAEA